MGCEWAAYRLASTTLPEGNAVQITCRRCGTSWAVSNAQWEYEEADRESIKMRLTYERRRRKDGGEEENVLESGGAGEGH